MIRRQRVVFAGFEQLANIVVVLSLVDCSYSLTFNDRVPVRWRAIAEPVDVIAKMRLRTWVDVSVLEPQGWYADCQQLSVSFVGLDSRVKN
jgi:hypothetical protein